MTTRAQLQSKSIDELREIAQAAELETDGLQKSKLITALMNAGQVVEDVPAEVVDLPKATPRTEKPPADDPGGAAPRDGGIQRQRDGQRGSQGGQRDDHRQRDGQGGQGQRSRNRRRRDEEQIPEGDLEVREGLLDILPEGYGFLRVTGYVSGENDVYVSANQVRKFVSARATLSPARFGLLAPRKSSPQPSASPRSTVSTPRRR